MEAMERLPIRGISVVIQVAQKVPHLSRSQVNLVALNRKIHFAVNESILSPDKTGVGGLGEGKGGGGVLQHCHISQPHHAILSAHRTHQIVAKAKHNDESCHVIYGSL